MIIGCVLVVFVLVVCAMSVYNYKKTTKEVGGLYTKLQKNALDT